MFAALLRLLPALMSEGGGLSGLLGRAGMTEGLAEQQAAKQGLTGAAKKEGEEAFLNKLHERTKGDMKFWLTNRGNNAQTTPTQVKQIADAIHGGMGGGKGPPANRGNAPAGQPDPDDQKKIQLQKQANQLQAKANQQQAQANRGWTNWLSSQQKAFLLQQALSYATFSLLDVFQKIRDVFSGLGKNLPTSPKGFVGFTSKMIDLSLVLPKLAIGLNNFAEGVSESNRNLARWNGTILASFTRLDVRRMQAERRTGVETQASTVLLNEALGDLVDAVQPLQAELNTVTNIAGTGAVLLTKLVANSGKAVLDMTGISDLLKKIEDKLKALGIGAGGDPNNRLGLRILAAQNPGPGNAPRNLGGAVPRAPLPRRLVPNNRGGVRRLPAQPQQPGGN